MFQGFLCIGYHVCLLCVSVTVWPISLTAFLLIMSSLFSKDWRPSAITACSTRINRMSMLSVCLVSRCQLQLAVQLLEQGLQQLLEMSTVVFSSTSFTSSSWIRPIELVQLHVRLYCIVYCLFIGMWWLETLVTHWLLKQFCILYLLHCVLSWVYVFSLEHVIPGIMLAHSDTKWCFSSGAPITPTPMMHIAYPPYF